MTHHIWTNKEITLLKRLFANTLTKDIAERLGCSESKINHKAYSLGLKKSEEFKKKIAREMGLRMCNHPAMTKNRFRKGVLLPHQFMAPKGYHIPGSEKNWFPKGHLPANTLHDGAIVIRTYSSGKEQKWIRISKAKWQELQRYKWEKKYGKIPKGMILRSKNGDSLDCRLSNWELINRAKNCELNSGTVNLRDGFLAGIMAHKNPELKEEMLKHPEILELKRTEIKLRRAIKNVA